jgi:iron complex outermembrane receptor protein
MSMKFNKIFLLTAVTVSIISAATAGEITGVVFNDETLTPLEGANISLEGTRWGTTTDQNGIYVLRNVPAGRYTIAASYIGFEPEEREINIEEGSVFHVRFTLNPEILDLGKEVIIISRRDESAIIEDLIDWKLSSTDDLLDNVEGIAMVKRGNANFDPVIRGLKEGRLNVAIDGVKIFGACPGRMDPPTTYLAIGELQNIEIVKGPNSVSMGANNLGGTINLIAKKPRRYDSFTLNGSTEVSYHSAAEGKKTRLEFSGGSRLYGFRLNGAYQNYGDYQTGDGVVPNSSFRKLSFGSYFDIYPSENSTIEFSFLANQGKDTGYPALPMDADEDEGFIGAVSFNQRNITHSWSSLSAKVYVSGVNHDMSNRQRSNWSMMQMEAVGETLTFGGNMSGEFSFSRTALKTGLDFYKVRGKAQKTMQVMGGMPMTMTVWPDAAIGDMGIFSEYQAFLNRRMLLKLGLRTDFSHASAQDLPAGFESYWNLDSNPVKTDVNLSGNLSLTYKLTDRFTTSGSFARGMRNPEFSEYYSYYALNRFDNYDYIGNPDLEIERNYNFELETRWQGDLWQAGITGFWNIIENYIAGIVLPGEAPQTTGAAGVRVYDNLKEAEIRGIEGDAKLTVFDDFHLFGNLSYAIGYDRGNDQPLPEMPPFESVLGVKYVNTDNGFWLQFSGRFAAEQTRVSTLSREDPTPGFEVFDLRAGFAKYRWLQIFAGVENIFDEVYYEHLNRNNILSQGRNIYLTLKSAF